MSLNFLCDLPLRTKCRKIYSDELVGYPDQAQRVQPFFLFGTVYVHIQSQLIFEALTAAKKGTNFPQILKYFTSIMKRQGLLGLMSPEWFRPLALQ